MEQYFVVFTQKKKLHIYFCCRVDCDGAKLLVRFVIIIDVHRATQHVYFVVCCHTFEAQQLSLSETITRKRKIIISNQL